MSGGSLFICVFLYFYAQIFVYSHQYESAVVFSVSVCGETTCFDAARMLVVTYFDCARGWN